MTSPLADIVVRLLRLLEEENKRLSDGSWRQALQSLTHMKGQLLLELTSAQRHFKPDAQIPTHRLELHRLRAALENNQRLLSMHLAATREVSDTILEAMRQADSDGTYSSSIRASQR